MKTSLLALAAATLMPMSFTATAAPPPGGGRHAVGPYPGGAYVRPVPPVVRPGYRPGYYPGYRPGWNVGYWGPRAGWYYGSPGYWGYWGGWPYAAAAWGVGATALAVSYPYVTAPIVVNTVATPQVYIEQDPAPAAAAPQAGTAASYWYYCTDPAGYFPYVKDCRQAWLKVVPQAPGEQATPPQLAR